jgi:molybdopterin-guanine dinucleotide biosynthesis protein A
VVFDAIILAGAHSARLNGADKALLDVGGETLLERAVDAVKAAGRTVAVGPVRDGGLPVIWVQEHPPEGGPVAALAAGLGAVQSDLVAVLAVDHPLLTSQDIEALLLAVGVDGAAAKGSSGRIEPLLAVYRRRSLQTALDDIDVLDGARMQDLIGALDVDLVDLGTAARDCDTWEEIDAVRKLAGSRR